MGFWKAFTLNEKTNLECPGRRSGQFSAQSRLLRLSSIGGFVVSALLISTAVPQSPTITRAMAQDVPSKTPTPRIPQSDRAAELERLAREARAKAQEARERAREAQELAERLRKERGGDQQRGKDKDPNGDQNSDQGDQNKIILFSNFIAAEAKNAQQIPLEQRIDSYIQNAGRKEGALYPGAAVVRTKIDWNAARSFSNAQRTANRNAPRRMRVASGKMREFNQVELPILAPMSSARERSYFNGGRDYYLMSQDVSDGIWSVQGTRRLTLIDDNNSAGSSDIKIFNTEDGMAASFALFGASYGVRFSCTLPTKDNQCYDHNRMREKIDELLIFFGNGEGR